MTEALQSLIWFPMVLTIGAFQIGLFCQKKWNSPLLNPILIGAVLVVAVLLLTGFEPGVYQAGTQNLSWLLTPATVCLALPLYENIKVLKKNLPAILAGVIAGTLTSLLSVWALCAVFALDASMTVSLLPKSITTAMGMVLSRDNGGIEALTTTVILVTGILGNLFGSALCKVFRLQNPISQGVAFGTASHVVGTSRASEISPLTGAVSSLSLTVSGILTALLFPLVCSLL